MGTTSLNPAVSELLQMQDAKWSAIADDDAANETVPITFFKKLIDAHLLNPADETARRNVGLIALLVGVSEWGVSGEGLPDDPAHRNWKSNSGPTQGKHLMSYDMGGIGISHADSAELGRFIGFVVENFVKPEHKTRYLRFADAKLYNHNAIMYDQIRSSGLCIDRHNRISVDLDDKPFAETGHLGPSGDQCQSWKNANFTVQDWQLFRHYMRIALRTAEGQQWLIGSWLDHTWAASLKTVLGAGGTIDEAIANARVRNSFPAAAEKAVQKPGTTPTQRIQREIDAYTDHKRTTSARRCVYIWRSVALFRHLAGEPVLGAITCPSEHEQTK